MKLTPRQLAVLKQVALVSSLTDDQLATFLTSCSVVDFAQGETIFREHEPADAFFVILAGDVKIYKLAASGDQQILHVFGPGKSFAEAPALKNQPLPAYAQALTKARLLRISRDSFFKVLFENRDIVTGLLTGLFGKLRELASLVEALSLKTVPARLADILLEESRKAQSERFTLRFSKQQIAEQIGTKPETLSRALRKLTTSELIEVSGREFTILDKQGLADLALGF